MHSLRSRITLLTICVTIAAVVLTKPVEPEVLYGTLEELIGRAE